MKLNVDRARRCWPGVWALLAAALALNAAPALGQVVSVGKGEMTIEVGRMDIPGASIASQIADPASNVPHSNGHASSFRLLAGYHFAEYLSVEVGLAHADPINSSSAYAAGDLLRAQSKLSVFEGNLVGHVPFATNARLDLSLGLAETALHTLVSTLHGSSLPSGETGNQNVRRLGPTAGLDVEYRISDVVSVLVGYHAYTRVGSPALRDSASGTATAILAGMHFEF